MNHETRERVLKACCLVAALIVIASVGYQWSEGRAWEIYVFASPTAPDAAAERTVPFPYKGTTYFVSRRHLDEHSRATWTTWLGFIGAPVTYVLIAWGTGKFLAPTGDGERR